MLLGSRLTIKKENTMLERRELTAEVETRCDKKQPAIHQYTSATMLVGNSWSCNWKRQAKRRMKEQYLNLFLQFKISELYFGYGVTEVFECGRSSELFVLWTWCLLSGCSGQFMTACINCAVCPNDFPV